MGALESSESSQPRGGMRSIYLPAKEAKSPSQLREHNSVAAVLIRLSEIPGLHIEFLQRSPNASIRFTTT